MAKESPIERHQRALNTGRPVKRYVFGDNVRMIAHPAISPSQFMEQVIPREYKPNWEDVSSTPNFNKNYDFPSLVESVKSEGIKNPITVIKHSKDNATGIVFDGHHRVAAAIKAGVDIPYYTIHPDDTPFWKSEYEN